MSQLTSRSPAPLMIGALLLISPLLSGCIVAAAGAGAAGGYSVLAQEEAPGDQLKDKAIAAQVSQSWDAYNREVAHDLAATVYEGRVLITGRVPNPDWRAEAVKRAWQVENVKEVYDEIEVGPDTHFMDEARDTVISTRLRNDMRFDTHIRSINYTVKTENGVVYIIGTARSREELNRVTDYARNTPNVRRVVSYVRIRSGEPPGPQTGSAPPPAAPPAADDTPPGAATPRGAIDVQPLR